MAQQGDPAGIIRYALQESRARGLDSVGQLHHAVRRVMTLRPDMGRSRAERLVQDAMWPRATGPVAWSAGASGGQRLAHRAAAAKARPAGRPMR